MSDEMSAPQNLTRLPWWYNPKKLGLTWVTALVIIGTWTFVEMFPSLVAVHEYRQFAYFMPALSVYYFTAIVFATETFFQIFAIFGAVMRSRICLILYMVLSVLMFLAWFPVASQIRFGMAFMAFSFFRCFLGICFLLDFIKSKPIKNIEALELNNI